MTSSVLRNVALSGFISFALLFSVNHVAFGDVVVNSAEAIPGSDTFYETKSTTIGYRIINTGPASVVAPDPLAACNPADGTPAFVTIVAPPEVSITVPPASPSADTLGFITCGTPKPVVFASDVPGDYVIMFSVSDAGPGSYATTFANLTLHVLDDTTAPQIVPTITGTLGSNGWYTSDVKVEWNVTDPESDVASTDGCDTTTISSDTPGTSLTCKAISAGGEHSQSVIIKRDSTAPADIEINGISDGDNFAFGDTIPVADCTALDEASGLASCTVTTNPDDNSIGTHTINATAVDNAGNTAEGSITYTINSVTIAGFFKPVEMDNTSGVALNIIKGGSVVPLKFEVFSGDAELTDVSIVESILVNKVSCPGAPVEDPEEQAGASAGKTIIRYDSDSGQFVYNWKAPKSSGQCYDVTLSTVDGSSITAHFKLK